MAIEIERKFLVRGDAWRELGTPTLYRQGYIPTKDGVTARARIAGEKAYLTLKGKSQGYSRAEYEYPIPLKDAEEILATLCAQPLIEKYRYAIPQGDLVWEVDEFLGENQGLILAEAELEREDQVLTLPPWIHAEVTGDRRYDNASLARHPYRRW
ncbi:MAG: CYTH domain-containing protein [Cyanobacteriota bacterium]|jgi:adenylate cyclase